MRTTVLCLAGFIGFAALGYIEVTAGGNEGCPPSFSPVEEQITPGTETAESLTPVWSPDLPPVCVKRGDAVAYVRDDTTAGDTFLYVQRRVGNGWKPPRQMTQDANYRYANPQWSPDGQYILYERKLKTGGPWSLFQVQYTTAACCPPEQPVAESATLSYRNAHWTPAGIVCEEETSSSLVKIAKVCCNTITYYVEDKVNKRPRWSPDGSKVVFSRGDTTLSTRDIYEYDTSPGGGLSVVFEDPGGTLVQDDSPLWGRDVDPNNPEAGPTQIFVMFSRRLDIAGTLTWHLFDIQYDEGSQSWGTPRQLTANRTEPECGEVFPAGFDHIKAVLAPNNQEKVLYVKRDQATSERQIFKLTRPPFSASSPEAIDLLLSDATFTDNNAPSWAPNEDAIVWQRSSGSPLLNRLWIIDSTMP